MTKPDRDALFRLLRDAVQALALSGEQALARIDPRCQRPDEIALDLNDVLPAVVGNFGDGLTSAQLNALAELDQQLSEMSGEDNARLWTETAVREFPEWEQVRQLARVVARAFAWDAA